MKKFCQGKFDEIIVSEDCNMLELEETFNDICLRYYSPSHMKPKDGGKQQQLFAYVYVTGHGAMEMTTGVLVNQRDELMQFFNLEAKFLKAARYKNTYTLMLFDCCRQKMYHKRGMSEDSGASANNNISIYFGC